MVKNHFHAMVVLLLIHHRLVLHAVHIVTCVPPAFGNDLWFLAELCEAQAVEVLHLKSQATLIAFHHEHLFPHAVWLCHILGLGKRRSARGRVSEHRVFAWSCQDCRRRMKLMSFSLWQKKLPEMHTRILLGPSVAFKAVVTCARPPQSISKAPISSRTL